MTAGVDLPGTGPSPPVFALLAGGAVGAPPDLLGPWSVLPDAPGGVAFGLDAGEEREGDAPVWRADLPADRRQAAARLADGEARLTASERALVEAASRLDALVASGAGVSFGVSPGATLAPPETALLRALDALRSGGAPVAFGLGDDILGTGQRAAERFRAGIDWLRRTTGGDAWVDTQVGGRLLGRTAVGSAGDAATVWDAALDPGTAALHARTLALALRSRAANLRMLALAVQGAVALSLVLAPGGALLALPATWRFVTEVVREIDAFRDRDEMEAVADGD